MHEKSLITLTIDTLFIKCLNIFEVAFFHWELFRPNQSKSCLHFIDRVQHTFFISMSFLILYKLGQYF